MSHNEEKPSPLPPAWWSRWRLLAHGWFTRRVRQGIEPLSSRTLGRPGPIGRTIQMASIAVTNAEPTSASRSKTTRMETRFKSRTIEPHAKKATLNKRLMIPPAWLRRFYSDNSTRGVRASAISARHSSRVMLCSTRTADRHAAIAAGFYSSKPEDEDMISARLGRPASHQTWTVQAGRRRQRKGAIGQPPLIQIHLRNEPCRRQRRRQSSPTDFFVHRPPAS